MDNRPQGKILKRLKETWGQPTSSPLGSQTKLKLECSQIIQIGDRPEFSRIGLSEKEVERQGIAYCLFKVPMDAAMRATTLSETRGFLKTSEPLPKRLLHRQIAPLLTRQVLRQCGHQRLSQNRGSLQPLVFDSQASILSPLV
jgi:hypothetical protein